jgi:hypothetical protein
MARGTITHSLMRRIRELAIVRPFSAPRGAARRAPLRRAVVGRVPDSFIVVYDDDTSDPDATTERLAAKYGFVTSYRYRYALKGFAANLSPAVVAGLRCEAGVAYIEEDQYVRDVRAAG